jgi:hypothetical protein
MEDVPGSAIGPKILKRAPPRKHAVGRGTAAQLQPVVDPQVSQRMQVPLRTRLK